MSITVPVETHKTKQGPTTSSRLFCLLLRVRDICSMFRTSVLNLFTKRKTVHSIIYFHLIVGTLFLENAVVGSKVVFLFCSRLYTRPWVVGSQQVYIMLDRRESNSMCFCCHVMFERDLIYPLILRGRSYIFFLGLVYTCNVVMYNVVPITDVWRSIHGTQLTGVYFDDVTSYMCRLQVFPCRTPRGTHS